MENGRRTYPDYGSSYHNYRFGAERVRDVKKSYNFVSNKTIRIMDTIVKYDNVFQYNESRGVETLHPLVSVIDFSKCGPARFERQVYGFYTIYLKEVKCGDLRYGRNYYDYQEGTLVFLAPGQVIGYESNGQTYQPKGWALLFHPDLLRGTSLGRNIGNYSFFSYEVSEALHLSEQERSVVVDCLQNILAELQHSIDKHGTLVRRTAAPVGQLFRRPGETRNRKIGPGVHPVEGDRHRQGAHLRHHALDQRGGLFAGIPLSAAFHAPVQEGGGVFAQRIPDRQLTQKTLSHPAKGFFTHKH